MAGAKHTAGPWVLEDVFIVHQQGDRVVEIAEVLTEDDFDGEGRLVGQSLADGLILAASLDLLVACRAAWLCISELPPTQARVEVTQMLQAAVERAGQEL